MKVIIVLALLCAVSYEVQSVSLTSPALKAQSDLLEMATGLSRFKRQVVADAKACMARCEESDTRFFMSLALKTFDRFCIDRRQDFEDFIPCYRRSMDAVNETCTPECGGVEKIEQLKFDMKAAVGDIDALFDILGEICELVSCQKKCETKVMTSVCGSEEPGKLLESFGTKQYRQMKDKFEDAGIGMFWPDSCTALTEDFLSASEEEIPEERAEAAQDQVDGDNVYDELE